MALLGIPTHNPLEVGSLLIHRLFAFSKFIVQPDSATTLQYLVGSLE